MQLERGRAPLCPLPDLQITVSPFGFSHSLYRSRCKNQSRNSELKTSRMLECLLKLDQQKIREVAMADVTMYATTINPESAE